jgi:hypothetical protein
VNKQSQLAGGAGRDAVRLYKQTQFGGTPSAACRLGPARAGCTNKPNSARSRRCSPHKQTQFAPAGQAGGAVAGANRATTPRCPVSFRQQTQFRRSALVQTNPILRLRIADWGLRIQKGLRPAARACRAGCTNKPNFRWPTWCPQGNSAEQSQFRQSAGGAEGEMCETKLNLGKMGHLGDDAPGKGQSCDNASLPGVVPATNPIPGKAGWPSLAPARPIVRHRLDAPLRATKPNLGGPGVSGEPDAGRRANAPNKPNSGEV